MSICIYVYMYICIVHIHICIYVNAINFMLVIIYNGVLENQLTSTYIYVELIMIMYYYI